MIPYFIWKGESSLYNSVIVNKLPPIITPEADIEKIPVPGRDGYLTFDYGARKGIIKPAEVTFKNASMNLENIDYIKKWLRGTDYVTFSNEPDRKYRATIISEIDFEKIITEKFRKFIILFDCQPHAYALDNNIITITGPSTILNPGTANSDPIIKVYGSGDITLTINGVNINLYNVVDYVTIDSVLVDAYKDTVLKNNDMLGDFPELIPGENSISWIGTVTKIEITPNWRYL